MAASDFTNIRVESPSWDLVLVRYDYANTNAIEVYRAPHGGSFAKIITVPSTFGSYPSPLYDDSVAAETYYDYKLSDDNGATFTSVVNVQSQKRFPNSATGAAVNTQRVDLPAYTSEQDVNPSNLQQMSDSLQSLLNGEAISAPRPCVVCPANGAITLDCSTGCYRFIIPATDITNINSISMNCESAEMDFDVPNGTTIEICGFPSASSFTGDECFQAPISSPVGSFNIITKEQPPCTNLRTRIGTNTCGGSFTEDCYDTGALIWATKPNWNPASACGAGTTNYVGSISGTVLSGDMKLASKPHPIAGFSLLFGKSGQAGGPPWECHLAWDTLYVTGTPIYGLAINVTFGSTIEDFTGLVLLLNHVTNQFVFGTYTNANLRTGDTPVVIASATMPALVKTERVQMLMENFIGPNSGVFECYDNSGNTIFSHIDGGHTGPSDTLTGFGAVWPACLNFGTHAARYTAGGINIYA